MNRATLTRASLTRASIFFLPPLAALLLASCSPNAGKLPGSGFVLGPQSQEELKGLRLELKADPTKADALSRAALIGLALAETLEGEAKRQALAEAKAWIHAALALRPQSAKIRLLAGKAAWMGADYLSAIQELKSAVILDGDLIEGHYLLGEAYRAAHKPELAMESLTRALELEPLYFEAELALVELGMSQSTEQTKLAEYALKLEKALALRPKSKEARLLLAELNLRLGAIDKARGLLEEGLRLDPKEEALLQKLAEMDLNAGRYEEARKRLASIEEPGPEARILGLRLNRHRDPGNFRKSLKQLIQQHPERLELLYWQAELAGEEGELNEAARIYQKILRLDPDQGRAHFRLSRIYRARGDERGADWSLEKASELDGSDLELRLYRAELLVEQGYLDRAQRLLESYQLPPDHLEGGLLLAEIKRLRAEPKQAYKILTSLAEAHGGLDVELALARLEIDQNQSEAAQARLDELAREAELARSPGLLALRARLLMKGGDFAKAARLLGPHAERGTAELSLLLGEAQAKSGQSEAALKTLKEGLVRFPRNAPLAQAYSLLLGLERRYREAIALLERFSLQEGPLSQLFYHRLAEFYKLSGQADKFNSQPFDP